nr:hypothetical protein B0A51_11149 [Rachicladosporium sp. CCFEE 5018]OQO23627.1 hypothetical protein B0A51_10013 [Rachicladosporium sp. CCFEE 5018]
MSLNEQATTMMPSEKTDAVNDQLPAHTVEERLGSSSTEASRKREMDETVAHDAEKAPGSPVPDDDNEYPSPAAAAVVMIAIALAIFLVALDRTIIATAIPKMTDDFHSLKDIGWYGSAFLLTACTFQLVLGRVYTFYPPKPVFLACIFLFEIGSAICGAAPSSTVFIVGRAIAGIGSAGVMSGAIVLMTNTIPLAKRPKYQGMFGAVFGVASIAGPLLGGAFTSSKVTWRFCFYINLPIGAVVLIIVAFILKPIEPKRGELTLKRKLALLDPLGNLFLTPSIVCLLLALQWGGSTYSWNDKRIIALFVVFVVLFLAFVAVQIFRQDTAMIPAHIIKQRSILAAMWWTFTLASAMMLMIYYVPIWFQSIKGVSAVQSGIDTIPMVLSLVVGTIMGGFSTSKIGYYTPLAYASAVIMPIGAAMISTWTPATGHSMWIGYQVLFGFGLGLGMQQGNMAAQTVLSKTDVPSGISLVFLTQMLGGAIFISVGQNILQSELVKGLQQYGIDPLVIVTTGATEIRNLVPAAQLPEVLIVYNYALRQTFLCAVGMACAASLGAAGLEWKSVKAPEKGSKAEARAIEEKRRSQEGEAA